MTTTDSTHARVGGADASAVEQIANVLFTFARLADEGTLEEVATVLTNDVEWHMPPLTWRGRTDVLAGLGSMRDLGHAGPGSGNRHVITNQEVHVNGDGAAARSYFQLVSSSPSQIRAFGGYRDALRRDPGGHWRLARREVQSW